STFKLNSYVIFDRKNNTEEQISKQTYFASDENFVLNLNNSSENTFLINNTFINASFKPTNRSVLEYNLNFSPQDSDLIGLDDLEIQRFTAHRNNRSYALNQVLNYKHKFTNYLFSSSIYHSLKERDDELLLSSDQGFLGFTFPDNDYSAFQRIHNFKSSYGVNANLSRPLTKHTSLRISYNLTKNQETFQSDSNANMLSNNSEMDVLENQLGIRLYNKSRVFLNYEMGSFYSILNTNEITNHAILPFASLKFNFKKTHALSFSYKRTLQLPLAENIIDDAYIANFNTLLSNDNITSSMLSKFDNFSFLYFLYDLFSGTLLSLGGNLIFGNNVVATNTENFSNTILNSYRLADVNENINFYLLLDKKFTKIPFKLRLKNTLTLIEQNNFISDFEYATQSRILSNGLHLYSNFRSSFFNFEMGYNRRQNLIESSSINISSKVVTHEPFLNVLFNFRRLDFRINGAIEFFNSEVSQQRFYRIAPTLDYKSANKKWTFYIKGVDILNMRSNSIIENRVFENYVEERNVAILGGFAIAGFKLKF
ncbi:MAG: hypothetical protein AAGA77_25835, partial [Bacteroidota bacterium]